MDRHHLCHAPIAHFSSDLCQKPGEAIVHLVSSLLKTHHLGLKFAPNQTKGFECFVKADFCENWDKKFALSDHSTSKPWSGWIIFYAYCPVSWASKLHTKVALPTTEAKYIAMSSSLKDVIPIMDLVAEIRTRNFQVISDAPHVFCKVFENDASVL